MRIYIFIMRGVILNVLLLHSLIVHANSTSINTMHNHLVKKQLYSSKDMSWLFNKSTHSYNIGIPPIRKNADNLNDTIFENEEYARTQENKFQAIKKESIIEIAPNNNQSSYANVRRFINEASKIPYSGVHINEMINYFSPATDTSDHSSLTMTSYLMPCPWRTKNSLLFLKNEVHNISDTNNAPIANYFFVIDISGSMDKPNRLPLIQKGLINLINQLRDSDIVSMICFGESISMPLFNMECKHKGQIIEQILSLNPGGGTPGNKALLMSYTYMKKILKPKWNNQIIFISDGDFNLDTIKDNYLYNTIKMIYQSNRNIRLSCIGVGTENYKDKALRSIVKAGGGAIYYIDDINEANRVFLENIHQHNTIIGKYICMSVQFDPAIISSYRLIGYNNLKDNSLANMDAYDSFKDISNSSVYIVAIEITYHTPKNKKYDYTNTPIGQSTIHYLLNDSAHTEVSKTMHIPYIIHPIPDSTYKLYASLIFFGLLLKHSSYTYHHKWKWLCHYTKNNIISTQPSILEYLLLIHKAMHIY